MSACNSPTQTSAELNQSDQSIPASIGMDRWFSHDDAFLSYDQWFTDLGTAEDRLDRNRVDVEHTQLWTWLDDYDHERITLDEFADYLRVHRLDPNQLQVDLQALSTTEGISSITLLNGDYHFTDDLKVSSSGVLLVAAGSKIKLDPGIKLEVYGRLFILGTSEYAIGIQGLWNDTGADDTGADDTGADDTGANGTGVDDTGGYHEILIQPRYPITEQQPFSSIIRYSGLSVAKRLIRLQESHGYPILIEHNQLDRWSDKAISFNHSDDLLIQSNHFAMHSDHFVGLGEAIRGFASAVNITQNLFGKMQGYRDAIDLEECSDPHLPWVVANRFLGGQDDGIDLDGCSAYIINNHISHFHPPSDRPASGGVNGGGITGDRGSAPVLIGNVIDQCYHAVGFKDGAAPVLINNSITRSHIGLTLYRSRPGALSPQAKVINTLWSDNLEDIQLNGAWWPLYDPTSIDPQRLQISASCFESDDDFAYTTLANYNLLQSIAVEWYNDLPWSSDPILQGIAVSYEWHTLGPLLEQWHHHLDLWPQDLLNYACNTNLQVGALQAKP